MWTGVGRVAVRSGAAAAGGLVAAGHVGPGVLWLRPVRLRVWPALAGVGRPDHVALTFDDGPDPASTPRFLDLLAERGVRATFFLLGDMLERAPSLGAEIAAAGHELAVHGFRHRVLLWRGPRATHDDLARARDAVGAVTGEAPRWYRPPYGVLTGAALAAAARLGLAPVLWTAWGRDWTAAATAQTVLAAVLRDLRGGGTVLLHDSDCTSSPGSWRSALGALPHLLDVCAERGWWPGPLREHGLPAPSGMEHATGSLAAYASAAAASGSSSTNPRRRFIAIAESLRGWWNVHSQRWPDARTNPG